MSRTNAIEGASFPQGVRSGVMNCELALDQAQTGCVVDTQRTVRASADRGPHRGGASSSSPAAATGVAGRMAPAYAGARPSDSVQGGQPQSRQKEEKKRKKRRREKQKKNKVVLVPNLFWEGGVQI